MSCSLHLLPRRAAACPQETFPVLVAGGLKLPYPWIRRMAGVDPHMPGKSRPVNDGSVTGTDCCDDGNPRLRKR